MATDLITSTLLASTLARSIPTIQAIIAKSLNIKGKDIEITKDADRLIFVVRQKITTETQGGEFAGPQDVAADALFSTWIVETRKTLSSQRKAGFSEANTSFIIAISSLIIGILLVFAGVVLIFIVGLNVGIVTSASSIVSGIISGLAFKFNQQAHDRLQENAKEMNRLDSAYIASEMAAQIADSAKRDETIEKLVDRIYPKESN